MSGSLCGCLILSQDVPVIRQWSPLYVMITVIVVMSEKVDTTITKGKSSANSVYIMIAVIVVKVETTITEGESSANSVYVMVTVIVVMSEKVDTTITKGDSSAKCVNLHDITAASTRQSCLFDTVCM